MFNFLFILGSILILTNCSFNSPETTKTSFDDNFFTQSSDKQRLELDFYQKNIHPKLLNKCSSCHQTSQLPKFAVSNASDSLEVFRSRITSKSGQTAKAIIWAENLHCGKIEFCDSNPDLVSYIKLFNQIGTDTTRTSIDTDQGGKKNLSTQIVVYFDSESEDTQNIPHQVLFQGANLALHFLSDNSTDGTLFIHSLSIKNTSQNTEGKAISFKGLKLATTSKHSFLFQGLETQAFDVTDQTYEFSPNDYIQIIFSGNDNTEASGYYSFQFELIE